LACGTHCLRVGLPVEYYLLADYAKRLRRRHLTNIGGSTLGRLVIRGDDLSGLRSGRSEQSNDSWGGYEHDDARPKQWIHDVPSVI
jgi:hypothetical protein